MHLQFYQEAEPIAAARPFVRRIIYCDIPEPVQVNVPAPPTGYNHIGWAMRGDGGKYAGGGYHPVAEGQVHVAGQTVRTPARIVLKGRVRHMLAEFTATGMYAMLGLNAQSLVNRVFDPIQGRCDQIQHALARVNPEGNMADAIWMFQRALTSFFINQEIPLHVTRAAGLIEESQGLASISEVHEGISERQLQRGFNQVLGCSPKYFAQVIRLNATLVSLVDRREEGLAAVAARHGFVDQSHMVREIQAFLGQAPSEIRYNVNALLRTFPTAGASQSVII